MTIAASDTWVLGNELFSALMPRMDSIHVGDKRSDNGPAFDSG